MTSFGNSKWKFMFLTLSGTLLIVKFIPAKEIDDFRRSCVVAYD